MIRALLLIACLSLAGTAQAQGVQTAYAGGSPIVLTIPVTASIGGRCGFADGALPAGSFHKANFDQSGFSAQFDFSLNCTGPSRVAIASANGGLLTQAGSATGYRDKADYQISLNLQASDGSKAQASCAASAVAGGGACAFAGTASASQGLHLAASAINQPGSYVRVSAPAQSAALPSLVEGTYSDVLTVTVSPSL